MRRCGSGAVIAAMLAWGSAVAIQGRTSADPSALVAALISATPLAADLEELTDSIGGRPTGSAANLAAVEWGLRKFREAGIDVRKEAFTMPARWDERAASAVVTVSTPGSTALPVTFAPRVASMPFSTGTSATGLTAPLVDGGSGTEADFARLGDTARGAFVLVETEELTDIDGLFREYVKAQQTEARAFPRGVAGVVYVSSRPHGLLYRHNASLGPANRHPMMIMEREEALRALRLIRLGRRAQLTATLDIERGGPFDSYNVVGEIRGGERPNQIVLISAHLDSWGLGTGANDNGCNVALVIDIARQMKRLGLQPKRTIRFALFNGEEQGMLGSWGYTRTHDAELDGHVLASSYDIGSGRINGFFTGGRPDVVKELEHALPRVAGLGPFETIDAPIVGTDNYDFMMQGIPNLVANQEPATYGINYHARSDTFDKVDLRQLRINAAIAAAVTWAFADSDVKLPRQSHAEIDRLVKDTDLSDQMKSMGMWDDWASGVRGRKK
jgi:carboxypeptidase Q